VTDELALDLAPTIRECLRCRAQAPMRFAGLCDSCRAELRATLGNEARTVETVEYAPKRNVTPNAVALKDD
jgi:hypothetical protein